MLQFRASRVGLWVCSFSCLTLFVALLTGCNAKSKDSSDTSSSDTNTIGMVVGAANNAANDTENTSPGLLGIEGELSPFAACDYTVRSSCTSNVSTVSFSGCTITGQGGGTATLDGGWTNTYNSAPACVRGRTGALIDGDTVTRTTDSTYHFTITASSGAYLRVASESHSAWDGTSIPATGVTVTKTSTGRTISIGGLHNTINSAGDAVLLNQSLKTTSDLVVSGTKSGGNRAISSGTIKVYHNIARFNGTYDFSNVVWGSTSCCYPTSGTIAVTYSSDTSFSASVTFSSTCGQATWATSGGSSETITLPYCQ